MSSDHNARQFWRDSSKEKVFETTFRDVLILRSIANANKISNVDQQCKDMEDNPHVLNHVQGLFALFYAAIDKEERDNII